MKAGSAETVFRVPDVQRKSGFPLSEPAKPTQASVMSSVRRPNNGTWLEAAVASESKCADEENDSSSSILTNAHRHKLAALGSTILAHIVTGKTGAGSRSPLPGSILQQSVGCVVTAAVFLTFT